MLTGKINKVKTKEDYKNDAIKLQNIINAQLIRVNNYKLNKTYPTDSERVIPCNIYQTWHTKDLPPLMNKHVQHIIKSHPRFTHYLYDDNDCREFIKMNYNSDVLFAFDNLIPGAYKADLWRYCILYKNGGIYMDIKYTCINSFKLLELTRKEHFVLDVGGHNIYNALMSMKPGNSILLNCINQIVSNVKNKYYGGCCLSPTGPAMLASFLNNNDYNNIILQHMFDKVNNKKLILMNNIPILKMYEGYYEEQDRYKKVHHYGHLWNIRQVYK
jgi:mannosyltransferase OCH1-like enzyme